jgi:hypothetical protein
MNVFVCDLAFACYLFLSQCTKDLNGTGEIGVEEVEVGHFVVSRVN